jgi:hypothetical protein
MSNTIPVQLVELQNEVIDGMVSYMEGDEDDDEDFDPGYTKEAVEHCDQILKKYLEAISSSNGDSANIMATAKSTVLALNALNEKNGHNLIETDQREGICELIITAANLAGLKPEIDDITEEWREW